MLKHFFRIFIVKIATLTLTSPSIAAAQDRLSEGRLSISPFLIDTEVSPGWISTHTITIYNTDSVPHQLTYSIQDFVPQGPKGEPRFLTESDITDPTITLSSWIKVIDQPDFTISANSSTDVTFEIEAPPNATAGSHYAGLLFSFENTPGQDITVARKIGAIILARYGKGRPSAALSVSAPKNSINKAFIHSATIANTGNVHLSPKGKLNFYNVFGRLVESVPINPNAKLILPGLQKEFTSQTKGHYAGLYRVETIVFYSSQPTLELRHSQWVGIWPINTILSVIAGLFISILLFRKIIRQYNNWVVKKYG